MLKNISQYCKSTQISYQFYNSIASLNHLNWEDFNVEENIFFSKAYLETIENSFQHEVEFNYIVFFDKKKTPIGLAITQLIALNTKELQSQELPCNLGEGIKNTILKNLDVNVLICGNPFACGEHHFIFNKNLIEPKEAYKSLAKALRDTQNMDHSEKPSFIVVKEFWPETSAESDQIKQEDFTEIHIDANMVLKLKPEWTSFEDYLASMRTKFRTRAKKAFNDSAVISVKNFSESEIIKHKDKINLLYDSVIDNAYFKLGKLNAQVFMNLKKALVDKFMFFGYFLGDELIGFKTCFVQKNHVEAFHIGFDYAFNKTHQIYQRMLYDYVSLAIEHKVSELRLGRTSETIKSTVGAKPVDMKLYVRHRNSLSNTLLKPLVDFVSPSEAEIRNPFKKTSH